jgi:hypothetical protein
MNIARLSLMLALAVSSALSNAAALYVNIGGNDTTNACTGWDGACATIAGAAGKAVANAQLRIAKGVYKFSSTLSVTGKNLSFIGGYDAVADKLVGDKYSTIISADTDNNDTKNSYGITSSYTGIIGTNTANAVSLSSGNYRFENMTFTGTG